jgi:hypothetical protein
MAVANYANDENLPYEPLPGPQPGEEVIPLAPRGSMRLAGSFGGYPAGVTPMRGPGRAVAGGAAFSAAEARPVGPSTFSGADLSVDRQFAAATDPMHTQAMRAMGYGGRNEHEGAVRVAAPMPTPNDAFHEVVPNYERNMARSDAQPQGDGPDAFEVAASAGRTGIQKVKNWYNGGSSALLTPAAPAGEEPDKEA